VLLCQKTPKTIQNELLGCMYEVYKQTLMEEIQNANFVSIKANETTDISCMSQFVILLRYVKRDGLVERFNSSVQAQNRTAECLASVLKQELVLYKLGQKLIAVSYDDAAVFSGGKNGVQVKMKDTLPHAHFIHCYAHQSNLVMKQACSTV
jgi:hypothetical protein